MQLKRHSNSAILSFESAQLIGSGGEGSIFAVGRDNRLAAKVYHKPTAEHEQKLTAMFRNPPDDPMRSQGHASIAWPIDLLRSVEGNNRVVGFLMPRVPDMFSVIELFVPRSRLEKCPLFTYQYLHRAGRNIAAALAPLHARGYVVGDINESNILVSTSALVTLVDTDSFQVREDGGKRVFRCGVGKAEFTPPELQGRNLRDIDRTAAHDLFGLAVLIFQLLMEGTHPYAGQYLGEGDPPGIVSRIQQGEFPYGSGAAKFTPSPIAPPLTILDPAIRDLFMRCFEEGYASPAKRPTATNWQETLDRAEARLKRCRKNTQHRYGSHLMACPWCERAEKLGGRDYFPSQRSIQEGVHLAPPPPRQTPLPALQPSSTPKSSAGSGKRVRVKNKGNSSKSNRLRTNAAATLNGLARTHPAVHIAGCAAAGCAGLLLVRLALTNTTSAMHSWLHAITALDHRAALSVAAASLAIGVSTIAAVSYFVRSAAP